MLIVWRRRRGAAADDGGGGVREVCQELLEAMIAPLLDAVNEQRGHQLEGTGPRVKAGPHDLETAVHRERSERGTISRERTAHNTVRLIM